MTILGTQVGGSGTEARDEHMGAFFLSFTLLGYSPSSRRRFEVEKGQPLRCVLRFSWYNITGRAAGQERSALLQHRITTERRASYSVRVFPRAALSSFLQPVSKVRSGHLGLEPFAPSSTLTRPPDVYLKRRPSKLSLPTSAEQHLSSLHSAPPS